MGGCGLGIGTECLGGEVVVVMVRKEMRTKNGNVACVRSLLSGGKARGRRASWPGVGGSLSRVIN